MDSEPEYITQVVVDRQLWNKYVTKIISSGLSNLENTELFYQALNNDGFRKLIINNGGGSPQFNFLSDILDNQELTRCPQCGHYNDNIECPIIRCSYCDHEWSVTTPNSKEMCEECIAGITHTCDGTPPLKNS